MAQRLLCTASYWESKVLSTNGFVIAEERTVTNVVEKEQRDPPFDHGCARRVLCVQVINNYHAMHLQPLSDMLNQKR